MKRLSVLFLLACFLFAISPVLSETKSPVLKNGWESASLSELLAARDELDSRISELSPSSSSSASVSGYNSTVYISAKGKKYHSSPKCSNMKNPKAVTEEEAIRSGRTPCAKCY